MSKNDLFSFLSQLEAVNVTKTGTYDVLLRLQEYFLKENVSKEDLTNMLILLKCGLQFRDYGVFEELRHVHKLLPQIREDTAALTCEIFYTILVLDKSTDFERWFHTILLNVAEERESWLIIGICDSILDTLIKIGPNISTEKILVKKILLNGHEGLTNHFLGITVPKLMKVDSDVLKTVLKTIMDHKDDLNHKALNMLSCLSDFYLPEEGKKSPLSEKDFCDIIVKGLSSSDDSRRKTAMDLAKKAVCRLITNSLSQTSIQHWQSFSLLIESLENGDLSCLQAFETLKPFINKHWLNIAYKIGMTHKNYNVRHQCIEHRLKTTIDSTEEAKYLLQLLNDTELFLEPNKICAQLKAALKNERSFLNILVAIPTIPWASVPIFFVISSLQVVPSDDFIQDNKDAMFKAFVDIIELHHINNSNNNHDAAVTQHVYIMVTRLVTKMCKHYDWKKVFNILTKAELIVADTDYLEFVPGLQNLQINENEKNKFYEIIINENRRDCLRAMISYFKLTKQVDTVLNQIERKMEKLRAASSNHKSLISELAYFELMSSICLAIETKISDRITEENPIFIRHLGELLSSTTDITYNDPEDFNIAASIILNLSSINLSDEWQDKLQKMYDTAMSLLLNEENNDIKRKLLSLYLLGKLTYLGINKTNWQNDLESLLTMNLATECTQNCEDEQLKYIFNHALATVVDNFVYFKVEMNKSTFKHFVEYIQHSPNSGRLILWLIKAVVINLDRLKLARFDILKCIHAVWKVMTDSKEIDELNYRINSFTELIMHDAVIEDPELNEVVKFYFQKFKEMGRDGNLQALDCILSRLKEKNIRSTNEHVIFIIQELMMFTKVSNAHQRLLKRIELHVDEDTIFSGLRTVSIEEINDNTVNMLLKIEDIEVHRKILKYIMKTIDETLRDKDGYQANSQDHITVQMGVQHILFYALLQNRLAVEASLSWCMKLLVEKKHLPSVRICLEWFIALDIVVQEKRIYSDVGTMLSALPLISQEMIIFMALSHKMHDIDYELDERAHRYAYTWEEYNFVMQFLLKRTMLPSYELRVYSQILAAKIYRYEKVVPDLQKYPMIIVESSIKECENEKAYAKLEKHFFTNDFDVICHLVPSFIYKILPRYFGIPVMGFGYPLLETSKFKEYLERNGSDLYEKWKDEYYDDDIQKLEYMLPIGNEEI